MIEKDKELVTKTIYAKLAQADALLAECVMLAEESGVCFELPWGGEGTQQRGMGAGYVPETASDQDKEWNITNYDDSTGWQPSAGSC